MGPAGSTAELQASDLVAPLNTKAVGSVGSAVETREALHAEEAATLAEQGFDFALATECTTLCGMTYHSCSEKSGTGSELL